MRGLQIKRFTTKIKEWLTNYDAVDTLKAWIIFVLQSLFPDKNMGNRLKKIYFDSSVFNKLLMDQQISKFNIRIPKIKPIVLCNECSVKKHTVKF